MIVLKVPLILQVILVFIVKTDLNLKIIPS